MGRIETMANRKDSVGDLALVVSFTKMLDPGSVAREGEVALTQSAAGILPTAQNMARTWVEGKTLLPPNVRAQLLSAAREMYGVYDGSYKRLAGDYQRTAQEYGYSSDRVMMGYQDDGLTPVPPRARDLVVGRAYRMATGKPGIWDGSGFRDPPAGGSAAPAPAPGGSSRNVVVDY
jgi:hypothetical protein